MMSSFFLVSGLEFRVWGLDLLYLALHHGIPIPWTPKNRQNSGPSAYVGGGSKQAKACQDILLAIVG